MGWAQFSPWAARSLMEKETRPKSILPLFLCTCQSLSDLF